MNRTVAQVVSTGLCAALLAFEGCGGGANSGSGITEFPRSETLYVGGFQWGPPTSFNPIHVQPAWPMTGNMNLVYESMFGYNQITGELEGILGESYELGEKTLRVRLREGAMWHDGAPVTADDVVYTFELHRRYSTLFHAHWNYLDDVAAEGPHTVVFTLSDSNPNRLVMLDIISVTFILPRHVFEPLEQAQPDSLSPRDVFTNITAHRMDTEPVGSGPYTLHAYSGQKIILKRVDHYWGNSVLYDGRMPAPTYIIHSSYTSNDKFNLALQQGNLDISQTFCPQIWNKFDDGVGTWYPEAPYYIAGIIPALLMNLTKAPFDDVAFRRAAAHAIDYERIRTLAIYGYAPPLRPGLILPFDKEKSYFNEDDAKAYGVSHDPDKAREILREAGYSWGEDGMLIGSDGKALPTLSMTCPSGWTDWEATIRIAVSGMREVGIDVREKFVEYPVWDKELKNCLFDFTMKTPHPEQSASTPWIRFEKVMSSKLWAPPGQVMYENEGRYRNPRADSLLRVIPTLTDENELASAYRDINTLFMREMPVIPLMYRPWLFYQFNTATWDNYPTEKDPYAPPQCLMVGAGVKALWEIERSEG